MPVTRLQETTRRANAYTGLVEQVRELEGKLAKTEGVLAFYQRKYFDAVDLIAQYMAVGHTCDTTDEDRPLLCDCEEPTGCLIHGRIGTDGKCPRC